MICPGVEACYAVNARLAANCPEPHGYQRPGDALSFRKGGLGVSLTLA